MQRLYEKYHPYGFAMVAINTVPDEDTDLDEWRAKGQYTFPVLRSLEWDTLSKQYRYRGVPTNFLLEQKARILFRHAGYRPGDEATTESEIREILGFDPFP